MRRSPAPLFGSGRGMIGEACLSRRAEPRCSEAQLLAGGVELDRFTLQRLEAPLDLVDRRRLEHRLAALDADPRRHVVPGDVVALAVDAEGRCALLQITLAMNALHLGFLVLKSADHRVGFGS